MKAVVINSTGPMGSSVVCGLVEKFGYLNVPLRDLGIHDYLVGHRGLDDWKYFEENFLEACRTLDGRVRSGGINVPDRDASPPRKIIDMATIERGLPALRKQAVSSIAELYGRYRNLFGEAVLYKEIASAPNRHVQLSIDFHTHDIDKLVDGYQRTFKDVYFIHLHRDFTGWMESIASQRFSSPRKRRSYVYHALHRRYSEYENKIRQCPGLHLEFDSIFLPHTDKLIWTIADFLGEPVPALNWETERYDLFGNLKGYREVFTKADVDGTYLSAMTRRLIAYCFSRKRPTLLHDALVYPAYMFDLLKFLHRKNYPANVC